MKLYFFQLYKIATLVLLLFASTFLNAQKNITEEELIKKISETKADSDKVNLMIKFSSKIGNRNSSKSTEYALKAIELAKKSGYLLGLANAYESAGDAFWYAYNYSKSIDYYLDELKLADSLGWESRKAKAYYNIGWIKCVQQNIFSERKNLLHSLDVFLKNRDTSYIIQVCNGLAATYQNQSNVDKTFRDSATYYYITMIDIAESNSHYRGGIGSIYNNYAVFLMEQQKFDAAKKYMKLAISTTQLEKDTFNFLSNSVSMASLYFRIDSTKESKKILNHIIPILEQKNYRDFLVTAYETYYLIYEKEKSFEKALEYHILFKTAHDTLSASIFKSNMQEKESSYEIEKRENNIKKLEHINELSELRNKQNKYVILGMSLVAVLIIGFSINLFRSNKNKQKANQLLSQQNKIIAEKKEEIEQSIHYAKGIQNAILPSVKDLKAQLPESFVIYIPKDVVSGDFYWFHKVQNNMLLAAADCTGHGVPGSLMSIVSIDKLNQAIFEKKLTSPAAILKSINNDVKNALKQDDSSNKQRDGLDIALISLNAEKGTITYSGANRPLWIIRENSLIDFKATKHAIAGHTDFNFEYGEQEVRVQKNDLILLFSDGYADQFGGKDGKKMMTRNFKDQVCGLANKPVIEIEQHLVRYFSEWKGNYEQVDDVLVIGFKI